MRAGTPRRPPTRPRQAAGLRTFAAAVAVRPQSSPFSSRQESRISTWFRDLPPDCVALAEWICDVLDNPEDENVIAGVRENVEKQCKQFPVYG